MDLVWKPEPYWAPLSHVAVICQVPLSFLTASPRTRRKAPGIMDKIPSFLVRVLLLRRSSSSPT
jgi:hypothetical protein